MRKLIVDLPRLPGGSCLWVIAALSIRHGHWNVTTGYRVAVVEGIADGSAYNSRVVVLSNKTNAGVIMASSTHEGYIESE